MGSLKKLTIDDFFERLYERGRFGKENDVIYLLESYVSIPYVCKNIEQIIYGSNYNKHFIPTVFYDYGGKYLDKTKESVRRLVCMSFDVELRKNNGNVYTPDEICELFVEKTGFKPYAIARSNTYGNYHVWIRHTEITGHIKAMSLWEQIQKMIARVIECDMGGCGAVHPVSLPEINTLWEYSDEIYDVEMMKLWLLNQYNRINSTKKKRDHVVTSFREAQILRTEAIQCLLNADFPPSESRQQACYTIALLFYAFERPKEETEEFLYGEWLEKAKQMKSLPFGIVDVRKAIKSAYSGKWHGPSKEYIEQITHLEFPYDVCKGYKRLEKNAGGRNNKKENQQLILDFFNESGGQIYMKQTDLLKVLEAKGVPVRSAKRHLQILKEEGFIDFQAEKGKYAKPVVYSLKNNRNIDENCHTEQDVLLNKKTI